MPGVHAKGQCLLNFLKKEFKGLTGNRGKWLMGRKIVGTIQITTISIIELRNGQSKSKY